MGKIKVNVGKVKGCKLKGSLTIVFIPNYKSRQMSPWQNVKVGTGRSLRTDLAQAGAATLSMVLPYYYYPTILVAILLFI